MSGHPMHMPHAPGLGSGGGLLGMSPVQLPASSPRPVLSAGLTCVSAPRWLTSTHGF